MGFRIIFLLLIVQTIACKCSSFKSEQNNVAEISNRLDSLFDANNLNIKLYVSIKNRLLLTEMNSNENHFYNNNQRGFYVGYMISSISNVFDPLLYDTIVVNYRTDSTVTKIKYSTKENSIFNLSIIMDSIGAYCLQNISSKNFDVLDAAVIASSTLDSSFINYPNGFADLLYHYSNSCTETKFSIAHKQMAMVALFCYNSKEKEYFLIKDILNICDISCLKLEKLEGVHSEKGLPIMDYIDFFFFNESAK